MFFYTFAEIETKHFLEWKTSLPDWAIAMIIGFILVWVYWCYKYETASSSVFTKIFLGFLRILILIGLLAILCEPVIHEETSKTRKPYLVFMVDTSLSMNIKDHYEKGDEVEALSKALELDPRNISEISRIEVAKKTLSASKNLKKLQEECEVKFFKFDGDLTLLPSLEDIKAEGDKTDIYQNLIKAIDFFRGRMIASIFVLTDGQDNISPNPAKKNEALAQAKLHAQQRGVKIHPVGVGTTNKKKDIVLSGVEAPEIALMDDKVRFDLELKNVGFEGHSIPVYLKWGETIIAEKSFTLGAQDQPQRVSIFHTFNIPEDYNITIVIPEQPGEFTKDNNMRQHPIKIIQQKLQVLYLESLPRWEYRYLKNALIRDETVIANTWLYSADKDFPQERSKQALSLGGFPDKETLSKFHCVILGDIAPQYMGEDKMKLLVEFVKDMGGGIAFIAGDKYDPSEYWDTPLSPLLPVIVDPVPISEYRNELQMLRLTPEGKEHPIMRLMPDLDDNRKLWEDRRTGLPGFYWYFPVTKAKPGATVLAIHETTDKPIMATQSYGKGNVFFTALDSSWRWRYLYGDRYFYRFWGQVIRHVSMGMLLGGDRQYYLRVDNSQYSIGDKINITLRIREGQKQDGAVKPKEVEISYLLPDGDEKTKKLISKENDPDTWEGSIVATRIGNHKIWFKPTDNLKEVSVFFNVLPPVAETGNTELQEEDMKSLIKTDDEPLGTYLKPYELDTFLKNLEIKKESITDTAREYPYWDSNWILLVMVMLFTAEWILRKIFRML